MGILNVTPDSFSDGGQFLDPRTAIQHGLRLAEEGADLVDVGGESTRPGAEPVDADEQIRRVLPVVAALAECGVPVSIDTSKAAVARRAVEVGAIAVNDVTAGRDPEMAAVCASSGCTVCLMHMQGEPRTMQQAPKYEDVVSEVRQFLLDRASAFEAEGVARERIWIDPGIGFGKTVADNVALLRHIEALVGEYPVLVGVSRKSFIGTLLGGLPPEDRLEGTLAAQVLLQAAGVRILRVHDVLAAKRASLVAAAILEGAP